MDTQEIDKHLTKHYTDIQRYGAMLNRSGLYQMSPVIISCAITGSLQGKEINPNLPETLEEQVQSTYDAYNAGAAMVHIHCRDPKNTSVLTSDPADYAAVNRAVRAKCPDIIINNTCVGAHRCDSQAMRMDPPKFHSLGAHPEVASLDLSPCSTRMVQKARPGFPGRETDSAWNWQIMISPDEMVEAAKKMTEDGSKLEMEIFGVDHVRYVRHVIQNTPGLKGPHWVSMITGGGQGVWPTPGNLVTAGQMLPDNCILNIIGIGACQTAIMTMAICMGYHVRVGLEDNAYFGYHQLAESNAQLVERAVAIAKLLGRPVATPAQARKMLGLGEPRKY